MPKKFESEYKKIIKDAEKNFKNNEDVEYLKKRLSIFVDVVESEIDKVCLKMDEKIEKIEEIEKKQEAMEKQMTSLQQIVDNIENDIYDEEGFDFDIICPYCDNEFVIDVDEEKTEVLCPNCNNVIELDWSGDLENNLEENGCGGNCGGCNGSCGDHNKKEDSQEDDM